MRRQLSLADPSSSILFPRGRAPFGQHQKSRPLARSNDIPVLNGFVNTIDWDQNQSDLSDLTLSMRRVTGSPWIVDIRSWTWQEVVIFGADQKERGLWGRECSSSSVHFRPQTFHFLERALVSLSVMRKGKELWGRECLALRDRAGLAWN